jgi:hypothetical protein
MDFTLCTSSNWCSKTVGPNDNLYFPTNPGIVLAPGEYMYAHFVQTAGTSASLAVDMDRVGAAWVMDTDNYERMVAGNCTYSNGAISGCDTYQGLLVDLVFEVINCKICLTSRPSIGHYHPW